jgi:hypothetical protein
VLDDPDKAERLLNQALALYQAIGDRYSVAAQIGNFGLALLRADEEARARPYLRKAADLFEAMGLQNYAEMLRGYIEEDSET